MKNNIANTVLLGSIFSLAIACNSKKEEPAAVVIDKEQIKKEIQAKEDEFANLYNTGEMKNIGYYGEDAVVYYQNKPPLVGKSAIVDFLKTDLDSNTNIIKFTTNEVFPSGDGSQVLEIGAYKVMDKANAVINSGNYMILFEKRNGKYESIREMSASDLPLQ